ncbi:GNAT family N-acetyltransferase [Actinomadura sp. ATCC 31491]|uniref:GNAT family N-acetyltransferase n=1 Tax=Actinomadura luzonensis TaxID=2805427 RepID=A0ABT0G1I5_9ACTN|nr:GNAT family N-acetyltransferase [Actinomadura luzonensis]MCK2218268.1 GNAT family N-acetyltransferase [Actinomadura luzonensis]
MNDIRLLGPEDLPLCRRLESDREWSTDEAKWRLMFEAGEVYAVDAPDGDGLAGCVVVTRYGDSLADVGMMLVAGRYGRQGLGTRLMRHALEVAGGRVVELTATRFGRPVYERLGFRPAGSLTITMGPLRTSAPTPAVRVATPDDHAALLGLDAEVTGADRSKALAALLARAERTVVTDGGFAVAWNAGPHRVIGPVAAPSEEAARELILAAAHGADRDVRIDLLDAYPGLRPWLTGLGPVQGPAALPTMVHGADRHPGDRGRYVAPILISMG